MKDKIKQNLNFATMNNFMVKSIGFLLNIGAYILPKYTARKGFDLFCTPFSPKLKPHQLEFLNTAELFSFTFEGNKIQGYKWGNGKKKIFLVHGWSSNTFRWKKLIEQLQQQDCTIYAIDAQANGQSEGKTVNVLKYYESLMQLLPTLPPIDSFVGHSIGGFVILYMMYLHPNLQKAKIVLMAAPGEVSDFMNHYQKFLGLKPKAMDIITQYFIAEFKQEPSYFSSRRFAKGITSNTLLIHDKEDTDTNYKYSEELSKILAHNKLILTEGLGHGLKADWINEEVVGFVVGS